MLNVYISFHLLTPLSLIFYIIVLLKAGDVTRLLDLLPFSLMKGEWNVSMPWHFAFTKKWEDEFQYYVFCTVLLLKASLLLSLECMAHIMRYWVAAACHEITKKNGKCETSNDFIHQQSQILMLDKWYEELKEITTYSMK